MRIGVNQRRLHKRKRIAAAILANHPPIYELLIILFFLTSFGYEKQGLQFGPRFPLVFQAALFLRSWPLLDFQALSNFKMSAL
jgi:hypothetical protein